MKRFLSLFLALVILTGTLAVFTACKAPEDSGAEIAVYLGDEIYDLDPTDYYVNSNAEQLMSLVFEPLFRLNADGKLEKATASKYKVDEEKRTIVIELRETYWSDDQQVKAEDYVYAWRNRVLASGKANPAAALFYDIENAIAVKNGEKSIDDFGAVATGAYEITITYREGADCEQLLKNLASVATSPARQDVLNSAEDYWTKITSTIVTNGPFRITDLDLENKTFKLERNLGYHQRPSVVDYDNNVTPAALVSFIDGYGVKHTLSSVDIEEKTVFYMLDANLEERENNKDFATVADDLSTYTYVFNTERELFAIPEVRRALSLALDRTAMANAISFAKPANSFVSAPVADILYNNIDKPLSVEQNIAEAKALLASVSDKLAGLPTSFTLAVNNDEESLAIAELARAAWRELGFSVFVKPVELVKTTVYDSTSDSNIEIVDSGIQYIVKNASYGVRDFDVVAVDWQMYCTDAFVPLAGFTSSLNGLGLDSATNRSRLNISAWWSGEYDSYINAAYNAADEEERLEYLRAAEELLLEEAPIIPLLYNQNFSLASEDISGVETDGYGNFVLTKMEQKDYKLYLPDSTPVEDEEEEPEGEEEETEE